MSLNPSRSTAFHRSTAAMPQNATLTIPAHPVQLPRAHQISDLPYTIATHQQALADAQARIAHCEQQMSYRQLNIAIYRHTAQDMLLSARACEAFSACAAEDAGAFDGHPAEVSRQEFLTSPAMAFNHGETASLDAKTTLDNEIQAEKIAALKQLLLEIDALGLDEAEAAEHYALAPRSVDQSLGPCQFQSNGHALKAMCYRLSAAPYLAKVEALESELRMFQDLLRDDLQVLRDEKDALNAALGVLEPGNLPLAGADSGADNLLAGATTTNTTPKDDDQDFDRSSEPATIGMVVVDNTPCFMPQHPIAAGWQDYVNPSALKAAAGMAIAAHLLFPDMTEVLVGLLGEAGSYDLPAALI